jgi:hypothetical protein
VRNPVAGNLAEDLEATEEPPVSTANTKRVTRGSSRTVSSSKAGKNKTAKGKKN